MDQSYLNNTNRKVHLFVFLAVVSIFFGRSMQLIIWEAPFRALIWDSELMSPILSLFSNQSWNSFVTNVEVDRKIQLVTKIIGFLLLFSVISTIAYYTTKKKVYTYMIYFGAFIVAVLILLEFKEKFYQFPQIFEGGIQVFTPIIFAIFYNKNEISDKYILYLKIAVIITFVGHGIYALNILPTPGHFVDMFIVILGVSEKWARIFLMYFGVLDLLVLILIFIRKADKFILTYATNWGFITAFARIVYYLKVGHFEYSSWLMIYLTIYRLAHGFIPLALLTYINIKQTYINKAQLIVEK